MVERTRRPWLVKAADLNAIVEEFGVSRETDLYGKWRIESEE